MIQHTIYGMVEEEGLPYMVYSNSDELSLITGTLQEDGSSGSAKVILMIHVSIN